jgi:hypothetical protein
MWVLLCASVGPLCLCGENRLVKESTTDALRSTETPRVASSYCTETRAKFGFHIRPLIINDAEYDRVANSSTWQN